MLVQGERDAPDHAAVVLAAHQPRIDDPSGREGADKPRHPDLAEVRIDLDLGEDGAMRMHGIGRLRGRVAAPLAATLDLGKPGAGQDVGIALAAAFVVPPIEPAAARHHAGIAGSEQRRALVASGQVGQLGDGVRARVVDRDAGRCRMRGTARDPGIRQVGRAGPELDLVEVEPEAVGRDLRERGPGALAHVLRARSPRARCRRCG